VIAFGFVWHNLPFLSEHCKEIYPRYQDLSSLHYAPLAPLFWGSVRRKLVLWHTLKRDWVCPHFQRKSNLRCILSGLQHSSDTVIDYFDKERCRWFHQSAQCIMKPGCNILVVVLFIPLNVCSSHFFSCKPSARNLLESHSMRLSYWANSFQQQKLLQSLHLINLLNPHDFTSVKSFIDFYPHLNC